GAANFTNTYLNKSMEVSADYNFRSLQTATRSLSAIEYLLPSRANQFRNQQQISDIGTYNHNFNSRIRWNIDSIHRIDFTPRIRYEGSSRDVSTDYITTLGELTPINESDRSNNAKTTNINFSGALSYMFRFRKPGRTVSRSLSGNKSTNDAQGLNLAITSYYRDAILSRVDTNNNRSITDGYGSGFNNRISFTESISKYGRLQANYSFRSTAGYSNRETSDLSLSGNKSTNDAQGLNLAITSYYRDAILSRVDTNNNRSITDGYGSGFNNRISFTESISKYGRLQANYSFRSTAGYSNRETY